MLKVKFVGFYGVQAFNLYRSAVLGPRLLRIALRRDNFTSHIFHFADSVPAAGGTRDGSFPPANASGPHPKGLRMPKAATPEHARLESTESRESDWKYWGPYLSERAWGTVREDYSEGGTAWEHFSHEHSRSRAYRWNEDGLGGICDRNQVLCFAWAFWNGRDPILKERLYGLTGNEGNHGEDVKEY